ncbi:MAG TPA: hypothetical protein VK923_15780 [Euzebyales bacterium]|nr:hypothetical protein [Euzebyales bacterium]
MVRRDRPAVGPDEHKAVARTLGVSRVRDLIVQQPESDPYYCGGPADLRDARWFVELLDAVGLADTDGIRLPRVHCRGRAHRRT